MNSTATPEGFDQSGFDAMTQTMGAWRGSRAVIEARGEDTSVFLQGQLSQDVAGLELGASAWSLLLAPQGKIVAWLRVTRLEAETFILDVDAGFEDAVVTRLERFRLRTRCDLTVLPWESIALRGPDAASTTVDGSVIAAPVDWNGNAGVDLLGPSLSVPADVVEVEASAWTAHRILAGEPMMGPEMDESTIPAATGVVDRSVSFTKGCYTGQELVARIDSRGGNVPKRLSGLVLDGGDVPEAGTVLHSGDKAVGTVTSAAWSPRHGTPIALGYVARAVGEADTVTIGEKVAQMVGLPFPS